MQASVKAGSKRLYELYACHSCYRIGQSLLKLFFIICDVKHKHACTRTGTECDTESEGKVCWVQTQGWRAQPSPVRSHRVRCSDSAGAPHWLKGTWEDTLLRGVDSDKVLSWWLRERRKTQAHLEGKGLWQWFVLKLHPVFRETAHQFHRLQSHWLLWHQDEPEACFS